MTISEGVGKAGNKADPLLVAGGIVTGNRFESSLSLAEKLDLAASFPLLFEIAAGLKRAPPS